MACTQLIPTAISVSQVPTTLDLLVLRDGVEQCIAGATSAVAAEAYAPLDIEVRATSQTVSPGGLLAPTPNAFTLMANAGDLASLRFSSLNAMMVRGHVELDD